MNLTEKMAYIKGLTDGMKLDETKDEVKVLKALIDAVTDIAMSVEDCSELYDELSEQVDAIDEDLSTLEDEFYDDDECDCDCDYDCDDDDCCCCDDDDDEEDAYYEVTCGNCGETICVSEDVLLCGEIECPKCGETLEFDFSDLCEDDDCECGCEDCADCADTSTEG